MVDGSGMVTFSVLHLVLLFTFAFWYCSVYVLMVFFYLASKQQDVKAPGPLVMKS